MNIFAILKSSMRLATAIFLSVGAMAVVIAVIWLSYNHWEKSQAKEYEAIKLWTVDLQANLQFSLLAQTKLVDRRFFIKVSTDAYPQYLKGPGLLTKNADEVIILNFVDKDGFKVFSKAIPVKNFSKNVDIAGTPIGISFEADEYMDVPTYASMAELGVQWTVDTVLPPVATIAAVAPEVVLDHCAPNLSQAERLRRLAQHGAVRQTGDGSYAVADHELSFFSHDNSLLDCR